MLRYIIYRSIGWDVLVLGIKNRENPKSEIVKAGDIGLIRWHICLGHFICQQPPTLYRAT